MLCNVDMPITEMLPGDDLSGNIREIKEGNQVTNYMQGHNPMQMERPSSFRPQEYEYVQGYKSKPKKVLGPIH